MAKLFGIKKILIYYYASIIFAVASFLKTKQTTLNLQKFQVLEPSQFAGETIK